MGVGTRLEVGKPVKTDGYCENEKRHSWLGQNGARQIDLNIWEVKLIGQLIRYS